MTWLAIGVMAAGAWACKVAGVLAGNRLGDSAVRRAVQLIPAAMFSALIVLQTFERSNELVVDARVVGLLVATLAVIRKVSFVGVILLAMAATSLTRLVFG